MEEFAIAPSPQLDYFTPPKPRVFPPPWQDTFYGTALVCWLVPLVLGIANFICWWVLRTQIFKEIGKVIVLSGFILGATGVILGTCFLMSRLHAKARPWKDAFQPVINLFMLYFLSLILAVVLCIAVYAH